MNDELLSRREADEVLRRAVELHQRAGGSIDETLALSELQRLGAEIGIAPATITKALAEVRSEALVRPSAPRTALDRAFGAAEIVVARSVPGPRAEVAAILDAMLRAELFRVERNMGEVVVWGNPDSLLHRARRMLDVGGRLRLGGAHRITAEIRELGDAVVVRLFADLAPRRAAAIRHAVAALAIWPTLAAVIAGAVALPLAATAAALAGSVAIAGAQASHARGRYRREGDHVRVGLERLLDVLEHERAGTRAIGS